MLLNRIPRSASGLHHIDHTCLVRHEVRHTYLALKKFHSQRQGRVHVSGGSDVNENHMPWGWNRSGSFPDFPKQSQAIMTSIVATKPITFNKVLQAKKRVTCLHSQIISIQDTPSSVLPWFLGSKLAWSSSLQGSQNCWEQSMNVIRKLPSRTCKKVDFVPEEHGARLDILIVWRFEFELQNHAVLNQNPSCSVRLAQQKKRRNWGQRCQTPGPLEGNPLTSLSSTSLSWMLKDKAFTIRSACLRETRIYKMDQNGLKINCQNGWIAKITYLLVVTLGFLAALTALGCQLGSQTDHRSNTCFPSTSGSWEKITGHKHPKLKS